MKRSGSDDQAYQTGRKLFLLDDEDSLRQAEQELSRGGADSARGLGAACSR